LFLQNLLPTFCFAPCCGKLVDVRVETLRQVSLAKLNVSLFVYEKVLISRSQSISRSRLFCSLVEKVWLVWESVESGGPSHLVYRTQIQSLVITNISLIVSTDYMVGQIYGNL